jgi:hypothetical protein
MSQSIMNRLGGNRIYVNFIGCPLDDQFIAPKHFFSAMAPPLAHRAHVRFGSKADICVAKSDVRFTPNSDRKSGLALTVMSAFPLKADMCSAK